MDTNIKPLIIGIIPMNGMSKDEAFDLFIKENKDIIYEIDTHRIVLTDGTKIYPLSYVKEMVNRHVDLDQFLIFNDRYNKFYQSFDVRWLMDLYLNNSRVPYEYQILKFE